MILFTTGRLFSLQGRVRLASPGHRWREHPGRCRRPPGGVRRTTSRDCTGRGAARTRLDEAVEAAARSRTPPV